MFSDPWLRYVNVWKLNLSSKSCENDLYLENNVVTLSAMIWALRPQRASPVSVYRFQITAFCVRININHTLQSSSLKCKFSSLQAAPTMPHTAVLWSSLCYASKWILLPHDRYSILMSLKHCGRTRLHLFPLWRHDSICNVASVSCNSGSRATQGCYSGF